MEKKITVIKGDGIGPEIVTQAQKVLDKVAEKFGHKFEYTDILMGGCSIDACGVPLTDEAVATAKAADAVLLGAIGGNTSTSPWYKLAPNLRPEAGLLKIRKELGLFANLRPAVLFDQLRSACPLNDEIIGDGFDMMIMRELTGGLYFGARKTETVDGETIYYYTNGTQVTITGNVKFSVDAPAGFWLVFDENGKGATYNAPRFIKAGEVTSSADLLPMTRNGYTFVDWYTGAPSATGQDPTGEVFVFGRGLTETTTIYAKWQPNTTANYTVLIWKQHVDGESWARQGSISRRQIRLRRRLRLRATPLSTCTGIATRLRLTSTCMVKRILLRRVTRAHSTVLSTVSMLSCTGTTETGTTDTGIAIEAQGIPAVVGGPFRRP